jgi:putative protease
MAEQEIGKITHYYNHLQVGIIELSAPLKIGDTIHIKGAHDDFTQKVESIQLEHKDVEQAGAGDAIGVKVSKKVHENDKVHKVVD